jgi:hypothetical protein
MTGAALGCRLDPRQAAGPLPPGDARPLHPQHRAAFAALHQ